MPKCTSAQNNAEMKECMIEFQEAIRRIQGYYGQGQCIPSLQDKSDKATEPSPP